MLPAIGCLVFATLALVLTPRLHQWDEDRQWAALLQEARDCTAARDGGE